MLRKTLTILGTLASTTLFVGCASTNDLVIKATADCNAAYTEGRSSIQDHFDDASSCCKDWLPENPAAYAACEAAVDEARNNALDTLDEAHSACVSNNLDVLAAAIDSIKDIVKTAIEAACGEPKVFNVTQSLRGDYANVTPLFDEIEGVRVDLSGRAMAIHDIPEGGGTSHYTASLSGSIALATDKGFVALPAKARLAMSIPQELHAPGTVHSVQLEVAGAGVFESPESYEGTIHRNGAGRFVINAVLVDANSTADGDVIQTGIALELPLVLDGNRMRLSTGGMVEPEKLAPLAPNAIADWHRNFTVDMMDYAFFMESFASGYCDLNGDGETDGLDIEIFEDRFWSAFEG